jgi:hypothetical protein
MINTKKKIRDVFCDEILVNLTSGIWLIDY